MVLRQIQNIVQPAFTSLCLCSLLLFSGQAQAFDVRFNGYGSIVAGTLLGEGDEPYTADVVSGGTYDDEIRFEPETLVALRAVADINDEMTATVQITGKGAEGSDAFIEWAYVSYQLTPETVVNAGRFRLPLFYYSDFLDAAYAYHWIRPPADTYGIPASTLTGVNVVNTHYFNSVGLTTQIWYGAETDDAEDVTVDITKSQGINVMLEYEWMRLRGVYHTLMVGIDPKPLLVNTPGGLIQVDPEASNTDITYKAAAFMIDYESILWRSEYTEVDNGEKEKSGYVSLGYQFGTLTPHYTYSQYEAVEEKQTHTIGLRWDFKPAAALKVEYSNFHYESEGGSTLIGPVEADEYRSELLSVALDFIF